MSELGSEAGNKIILIHSVIMIIKGVPLMYVVIMEMRLH